MPSLKRKQVRTIRGAIFDAEQTLKGDRSQIAEYERDLAATACVALWDLDVPRLLSCLRRLTKGSPTRRAKWEAVQALTLEILQAQPQPQPQPLAIAA